MCELLKAWYHALISSYAVFVQLIFTWIFVHYYFIVDVKYVSRLVKEEQNSCYFSIIKHGDTHF